MSSVIRLNLLFAYAKTKAQISCAVTAQLISTLVFAVEIVQSLYFLNPKFQVSSHLQRPYSQFVSDLVRNPKDRLSHDAAHIMTGDKPVRTDDTWLMIKDRNPRKLPDRKAFTSDMGILEINMNKY